MTIVPRDEMKPWGGWRGLRSVLWFSSVVVALGVACSDDDSDDGNGGQCIGDGAVAGAADAHCGTDFQVIGACQTAAEEKEGRGGAWRRTWAPDAAAAKAHGRVEFSPTTGAQARKLVRDRSRCTNFAGLRGQRRHRVSLRSKWL